MKPFQRTQMDLPPVKDFIRHLMKTYGINRAEAKAQYNRLKNDEVFINDVYQVSIDRDPPNGFHPKLIHLSIKRIDKEPIHDWRDLQEIKTLLCGAEAEGLELYPAESRVIDGANQYHLWVVPPGQRIPFGFTDDRHVSSESPPGGKQRPINGNKQGGNADNSALIIALILILWTILMFDIGNEQAQSPRNPRTPSQRRLKSIMGAKMIEPKVVTALTVIITAAEIRGSQWKGVSEGQRPDSLIDELWESKETKPGEAEFMSNQIAKAVREVREWMDSEASR